MWNAEDIAIVGANTFPSQSIGGGGGGSAWGSPSSQPAKGHVKSAWDSPSGWPAIGATTPTESDWSPLGKSNSIESASGASVWSSRMQETVMPIASSSWSEVARKGASSVSSHGVSMLRRASGSNFDPAGGTSSWGKPVDQGTPWDVGTTDSGVGKMSVDGTGNGSALSTAGTSWNSVSNRENAWSSASGANKPAVSEVVYWKTPYEKDQWGSSLGAVRAASGWEEPQAVPGRSTAWLNPETPSNVWTGPPVQQDSSMVWNNPYPKKSAMLDKGTGIWGDPENQGEIKRWKTNTDDATTTAATTPSASCCSSSSVQRSPVLPVNNNNSTAAASSVSKITSQQSTAMSSVWKDSPIAPRPIKPMGSAGSGSAWSTSGVGQFGIGSLKSTGSVEGNVSSPWASDETGATSGSQASGVPCAAWTENHCASTPSSRHDSVNRRSVDSDAVPSDDVFANSPAAASNASGTLVLANQVVEQLSVAVKTGLIESHLLSQPLPPETLFKLNQLLQCITKLEQAESELHHLHSLSQKGPLNGAQQHEYQRISGEVDQLRATAHTLKNHINAHTAPIRKTRSSGLVVGGAGGIGSSSSSSNDLGNVVVVTSASGSSSVSASGVLNGSKVYQWKHSEVALQEKSQNGDTTGRDKLVGFELMTSTDPWSKQRQQSSFDWPCDTYLKAADHLSSSSAFHGISDESSLISSPSDKAQVCRGTGDQQLQQQQQQQASSGSSTATLDDGPPEFRPGQKWEWRDPREVAEDPNATPGSVKTSAISLTRLSGDSKLSAAVVSSRAVPDGAVAAAAGGVLYSPSTMLTVSSSTPKSYYDSKISNLSPNVVNDGWSAKSVRPPAQSLNMAYFNRCPRMVSSYANNAQFMPVSPAAQQWIVLLNAQLVDEQTLQFLFSRIGTVQAFVFPPGSGFAAVKFKDASAEKALVRLQPECSAIGLTAHLAKDAEVEKLIQTSSSHRQPLFQSAGSVAAHHGLAVWDVPPPPPSSWGPAPGHPPFGPPPSVQLPDHMTLISHAPGPTSIYGDTYYGGMERHQTY